MRIAAGALALLLSVIFSYAYADDVITVTGTGDNIGDNLDLQAVGSLFGDCNNLEDFENRLNNPDLGISNLDLNRDGQVDYLRVIETVQGDVHLVTLQAVIGENQFQDVATIRVEKSHNGEVTVQIIGAAEIYGDNYIIEPTYVVPPVFPLLFWASHYRPWRSPFRWGHYPHHFRPWSPYPLPLYQSNIQIQINTDNTSHQFKRSRAEISITPHKTENLPGEGAQQSQPPAPRSRTYSTRPADSPGEGSHKKPGSRTLSTQPRPAPKQ